MLHIHNTVLKIESWKEEEPIRIVLVSQVTWGFPLFTDYRYPGPIASLLTQPNTTDGVQLALCPFPEQLNKVCFSRRTQPLQDSVQTPKGLRRLFLSTVQHNSLYYRLCRCLLDTPVIAVLGCLA